MYVFDIVVLATTNTPQVTADGYCEKEPGLPTGGHIGLLELVRSSKCLPRMASSEDLFLGTYPGSDEMGVKPAGVGTVVTSVELVVVTVAVVSVVITVVVVA